MHHAAGWSQVLAAALDDAWKRVWSPLERGSEFKHGLGGKKKTGQKGKVCGYLRVGPLSCTCAELLARFEMKVPKSSCASLVSVGLDQDPQIQEGETSLSRLALWVRMTPTWMDGRIGRQAERWTGGWADGC